MGKSAPTPPPAPDYMGLANQQYQQNLAAARATAMLNNPNIITPFGTQTVTYEGDIPTLTQTLTPTAEETVRSQQLVSRDLANLGLMGIGTAQDILGTPYEYTGPGIQTSLEGVPELPVGAGMTGQEAILSRVEPAFARQEDLLRQRLANQGITPGSEAWNAEMSGLNMQRSDAIRQAAVEGLNLDIATQQQRFGQLLQEAQFGNQAAANQLQQELAIRNVPLNEIAALMSGAQVQLPQFQQYSGGGQIAAAPTFEAGQAQGQYAMDLYGQQVAQANAQNAMLGQIAGSALGMFDFGFGG
jgi:hypothetical protein